MSMPEGEEEISVYVRCRWFGTTLDEFRTGQGGAAFRETLRVTAYCPGTA